MKYFGFLARFVVLPLLLLRVLRWLDHRQGKTLPEPLQNWDDDAVLMAHAVIAVTYTTIWDNYLVASGVWGYDSDLVNGTTIGWVPIEEYTFFVLQPLLTGSWMQYLARRFPVAEPVGDTAPEKRLLAVAALTPVWLGSLTGLMQGNPRRKYLNLILGWALPPIMLQIGFGGDILWRNRRLLAASILPATAYLGFADSQAIHAGTWAINPENTTGIEVIPHLPVEEFLFFLLTNILLVFGVTLVQSKESEHRIPAAWRHHYLKFKSRLNGKG